VKVVGKGLTLIGTDGSCPPLPYIEVSPSEGKVLIARGYAVEYAGPAEAEPEPAAAPAPRGRGGKKADETPPPPPPPPPSDEEAKAAEERAHNIAGALDLVEEVHLETEGERVGKPTVAAIADITGIADVTAEEIDAALAAKEAAEAANA
jgi:hypothetical protein